MASIQEIEHALNNLSEVERLEVFKLLDPSKECDKNTGRFLRELAKNWLQYETLVCHALGLLTDHERLLRASEVSAKAARVSADSARDANRLALCSLIVSVIAVIVAIKSLFG